MQESIAPGNGPTCQRGFSEQPVENRQSFRLHRGHIAANPVKEVSAGAGEEFTIGSFTWQREKRQRLKPQESCILRHG